MRNSVVRVVLCSWMLVTLGVQLARADEYPRQARSAFWLPYVYDANTLALYHLDGKAVQDITLDLDALTTLDTAPGDDLKTAGDGQKGGLENAVPVGSPGQVIGAAELVPEGRFGGGLALHGGGLSIQDQTSQTGFLTVEFWLLPNSLSQASVRLVDTGACRLHLSPDGKLSGEWQGKVFEWGKLQLSAWTHVAMGISSGWPTGDALYLSLNGAGMAPYSINHKEAVPAANGATRIVLGQGIEGVLDEVRVSRSLRQFYPYELAWPQPDRKLAPLTPPYVRDAGDLLFKLDFDGSTAPSVSAPGTAHEAFQLEASDVELNPEKANRVFPPGVLGRAGVLGEGGLRPIYGAHGNIMPPRGTIAFWMRPLNWDNFTRDNRFDGLQPTQFGLFQLDATTVPGSNEAIYRKVGPLLQFTVDLHLPEDAEDPPSLHPGAWTHVAMTWEGADVTYYLNGEKKDPEGALFANIEIRSADDPYPYQHLNPRWWTESQPVTLRFTENRYWEQRGTPMPRTAIDDFRIYRRPLAPSEISSLVARVDTRRELKPLPAADMAMTWNGVSGEIQANITPLLDYQNVSAVHVTVTKEGESTPAGEATGAIGDNGRAAIVVTTAPLEFATYTVRAELLDAAGKAHGQVSESFTRTPPPWWKNRLGVSDKVMPPWTPVETTAESISVWGRQIRFAPSGLPAQIISCGEDVLAGPIRLEGAGLQAGDGPVIQAINETRAEARGSLAGPGYRIDVKSYTEFDGMIWFNLSLIPEGTAELKALKLIIPRTADSAHYLHRWSGPREFRDPKVVWIGELPAGQGVRFRSNDSENVSLLEEQRGSFIPYVMLTGDKRGMAWFAENDRGWTQSETAPAVTIERDGDTVNLVLNLISEPLDLTEPRTISFGLHPTPVRPLDPLWRQYPGFSNVIPDTFSGNNLKGRKGPTAFYLYPEDDWESVQRRMDGEGLTKGAAGLAGLYRRQLEGFAKEGVTDPPPQSLRVPGLYWDMQWNHIPPQLTHTREWTETWALNFQYYTPEFVEFCSWAWNDWVDKTHGFVRGAYIDDCWGAPITREGGPCTYKLPDGHVQPGFQFLGPRERFKRMRQISLEHGIWPHFTAHTTHSYLIPYHSFFELILDGEDHYSAPPAQADFLDKWPLGRLRFMHHDKWGLVTTWLGWHGNSLETDKWPAWTFRQQRAYTAGMAMHDLMWPFEGDIVKDFGLKRPGVEFLPYWQETGLATHAHDNLKIVAWKRPGRCLVLLVNMGQDRLEATVKLDPAVMGVSAAATIHQQDPSLLTYFDEDATTQKGPEAGTVEDDGFQLEEKASDLPLEERRANDPDGAFHWQDNTLTCPIRRHDYRLFEFRQ